jgi:hypothetical protein
MMRSKRGLAGKLLGKLANRTTRAIPVRPVDIHLQAPIASFTFDDFTRLSWLEGGRMVEDYGGRATYYAAGDLSGRIEDGSVCFLPGDLAAPRMRGTVLAVIHRITVPSRAWARHAKSFS